MSLMTLIIEITAIFVAMAFIVVPAILFWGQVLRKLFDK